MKIFICTMEDPVYTLPFVRSIIDARGQDIVGLAVSRRNRLTVGKNRSKSTYLLSLLLIMGPRHFLKNATTTMSYRVRKMLARRIAYVKSPSILEYAASRGIPTFEVPSVNDPELLTNLRLLKPDVIINQAQDILKKDFLSIPSIGVLNRHNSLLPKNRGRLTPFWVIYQGENETGVSIHFVTEAIDAGDVVVQHRFPVTADDDFNSVAAKNYERAAAAMLEALDVLETGKPRFEPDQSREASYNTVPTLQEAWRYRKKMITRRLSRA